MVSTTRKSGMHSYPARELIIRSSPGLTQAGSWRDILLPTARLHVCGAYQSLQWKSRVRSKLPLLWALPFIVSLNSHSWLLLPLITPLLGAVSAPYGWKPLQTYVVI